MRFKIEYVEVRKGRKVVEEGVQVLYIVYICGFLVIKFVYVRFVSVIFDISFEFN